jgi:acetyl-CoA synthetase
MGESKKNIPAGSGDIINPLENQKAKKTAEQLQVLAEQGIEDFWGEMSKGISWFKEWETVLDESEAASYHWTWFNGGKLNAAYNCLDRHVTGWRKNKAALIFEGELGDSRVLTYQDLYREVNKLAGVLKKMGLEREDIVTIYLPMIPETVIAMLACARLGVPHSVVFGGFSAGGLKERLNDSLSKVLITADGGFRRGKPVPLKDNADLAMENNGCPSIEKVIVVKRAGQPINMEPGRDVWYADLMENAEPYCEPAVMDAEDPLFILYSSGTTGKPKGILHTTGGYMVGVQTTFKYAFDCQEEDVYWCTADIGWITGHSYLVYGPLANRRHIPAGV